MALNIIYPEREQIFLIPPSIRDWLPEGDLSWFVIDAVKSMDLKPFYANLQPAGQGGASYDPGMIVALLVYAYANGVRSSRRIEQLCERDIAFRVICGNLHIDHTSIARFRQRHENSFTDLFVEVLKLCKEAKLTKLGNIAVDGTKIQGNASLAANRTDETLKEEVNKILAEAKAKDEQENKAHGKARGDELPAELRNSKHRLARIKVCLERIKQKKASQEAELKEKLEKRQENEAATGKPVRGRKPKEDATKKEIKANPTDPESRIMKNAKGFVQGFNAQAVANDQQIIIAAEVTQDENDQKQLHPMMESANANLRAIAETEAVKVVLADAGYTTNEALSKQIPGNIELIAATVKSYDQRHMNVPAPKGRIPCNATAKQRMERKLRTKRGKALYRLRGQIIEPIFGQIKSGQRLDRFSRRGIKACGSEWKLICATHNMLKLWRMRKAVKKGTMTD
ncbi:MAG: transposase [Candidatus Riflebacteria bacterium]|nr:transposase [Candidatus Riflebacteria bacterium]